MGKWGVFFISMQSYPPLQVVGNTIPTETL